MALIHLAPGPRSPTPPPLPMPNPSPNPNPNQVVRRAQRRGSECFPRWLWRRPQGATPSPSPNPNRARTRTLTLTLTLTPTPDPDPSPDQVRIIPVVVTAAEMSPVHCTLSGSALHSCKGDGFSSGERECLLICRDEYGAQQQQQQQ